MILADDALAIYIAAGLAGFLVLLCCLSAIVCKGPCRSFNEPVKSPFEMYMDPASKSEALQYKYESYQYHLMVSANPYSQQLFLLYIINLVNQTLIFSLVYHDQ